MKLQGSKSVFSVSSAALRRAYAIPFWLVIAWLAIGFGGMDRVEAVGQANLGGQIAVSFTGLTLNRSTNTFDTVATLTNTSAVVVSQPVVLAVTGINPGTVTLANAGGQTPDGFPYVTVPLANGRFEPGARITHVVLKFNNPNRVKFTFNRAVYGVLPAANHPPEANAGADRSAAIGQTLTLDGSASSDPDGDSLTYRWTLTQKPATSTAALASATGLSTSLTIDQAGNYTLRLIVNDGHADSAPALVVISTLNSKPVANAGPDQTAPVGQGVTLDGSASSDPDGDSLGFLWSLTRRPAGSAAVLVNPDSDGPRLTVDKPGHYEARLVVNDGMLDSDPDLVAIDTRNSAPVANAGPDLAGQVGDTILLDGSASSDVDGDLLSYAWSLLSKPPSSAAPLLDDLAEVSRLQPDVAGDYVAQLIVNDGTLSSQPDNAQVTVSVRPPPVNHAPVIDSTPGTLATVGQPYQYAVTATDQDGDALTFALTVAPAGLTIDPQSGAIQWTPAANQTGDQVVALRVQDSHGASASQTYTVTVSAPDDRVTAPSLIGLTRVAAEAAIRQAQFKVGALGFRHSDQADGIVLDQSVAAGAKAVIGTAIDLSVSLGPDAGLPPNPSTVAPAIDPTVVTTIYAGTQFLYQGDNPIQTLGDGQPLAEGTIDPKRAAVIRGKVLDRQDAPLSGVTVSILNHPELGQTRTRGDGQFDLAVNGGGLLTINYAKPGFLPSQRQSNVPWQDYKIAEDVVLIEQDTKITTIDLTANTTQVAQGSPVTDQDGTRQATVLIPPGAQAKVYNPDGSTRDVTSLHLRITEYTVGDNGPQAMPAKLPPSSAYTYAFEIKADEANVKVDGRDVLFDRPVSIYSDNFLNFPVGSAVPVGYYDKAKAVWIPSENGRVIKILAVHTGTVDIDIDIDTDGDDIADNAETLNTLGITDVERNTLAALYKAGQTLWRVQVNHFSTFDWNWSVAVAADAESPSNPPASIDSNIDNPAIECGSVIECENQVLRESIDLKGTEFSLHYTSDRVPGRKKNTIRIPLSGSQVPASLKFIRLAIDIAGRHFEQAFARQTNLSYTYSWDGQDAYGRPVVGHQRATIKIGYLYEPVYGEPDSIAVAFSRFYNSLNSFWGLRYQARDYANISQEYTIYLSVDARASGLAGWTLSAHHRYDPNGKIVFLGDGTQRQAINKQDNIITTVAGNGQAAYSGDGGPALLASLYFPKDVAVGPDGSLFILDVTGTRIRRVDSAGIITTVAGTGRYPFSGDGGPATSASFNAFGIAIGPDNSLYIADSGNHRIRRVDPTGIISTVAGDGQEGIAFNGDNGPATSASLYWPDGIALGPDGSFFIVDGHHNRIRRVSPDGIITTVAGIGQSASVSSGDGGLATLAEITPRWMTVGPDGSFYIIDNSIYIRRVSPQGIISTVAGKLNGSAEDGIPASEARLSARGIALGSDGSLYIAGGGHVRRVAPDGIITTVAGNGQSGSRGDGGPATAAEGTHSKVAVGPEGSLYLKEESFRIRRVASSFPGFQIGDVSIPSQDGTELYRFSSTGRHLRTYNALTGATLYSFQYDASGQLITVTDASANLTTIERDANGRPTAILGPFGQRSTLTLDANGYLDELTNPAGETYRMSYTKDGLLTTFTNPNGNSSALSYDGAGRLSEDLNAAGGAKLLTKVDTAVGYQVTITTALGRATTHGVTNRADGDQLRTTRFPDDTQATTINATDGTHTSTAADGTLTTVTEGPDPRFSMLAPIIAKATLATGGLTLTLTGTRTVNLSDPDNLLSLTSLTDTITRNGRTTTSVYAAATRTLTDTSAAGRKTTTMIDNLGRVVQSQATGVVATNLGYDARGRLASLSQGAAPEERTATLAYNPEGQLDTITDPLGRTASLDYDAAGRVTGQTLPDGREIVYGYDANGNLTSLTPPGRPGHLFRYTATDQTAEYQPPLVAGTGNTLYEYDLDRALTRITRPDGQSLDLGYDSAGRLSTLTLPGGQLSYAYDAATGKLTGITAPDDTLAYSYNGGLLTRTTWTGAVAGRVDRGYDNDFRVTSLSVNGANPIAFQYDADSLLTGAGSLSLTRSAQNGLLTGTALGSVTDSYRYNGFAEVTTYEAKYGADSLLRFEYTYDKLGRITRKHEVRGGSTTHTFDYGYDTAGRLVEVMRDSVVVSSYGYDANGNRTHLNGAEIAHYDDQDRLLDYQGATYQYTANGELQQKTVAGQTTQYDYDVLGNLRQVTLPGGAVIDYVIDGQNRRIGKKRNGVLEQGFLYQSQLQPIAELDGSGNIKSRFVYATGINVPDYLIKGGVTYRIVKDHLGSPRLVVNVASNTVIQEMDYDAFGNVTLDTNPGFQPFGFGGGVYDRDTKLVRLGARDYEAETAKWTAKDPNLFAGWQSNLSNYVLSDPVNTVDFSGLDLASADTLARVVCSGDGGCEVQYNDKRIAAIYKNPEAIKKCITKHEKSHQEDVTRQGSCSKAEQGQNPSMPPLNGHLSEIAASRKELECLAGLITSTTSASLLSDISKAMANAQRNIDNAADAGINRQDGPMGIPPGAAELPPMRR